MFWYWFILEGLLWKIFFWMYVFGFGFCNFLIFYYLVKFLCFEMLAWRLWNNLLFLTLVVKLFKKSFACVLPSFEYHFNSLLLTFITGVCSEIPCSIVSRFAETSYLNFMEIQVTGCHMMQDLGVENLGTDY